MQNKTQRKIQNENTNYSKAVSLNTKENKTNKKQWQGKKNAISF